MRRQTSNIANRRLYYSVRTVQKTQRAAVASISATVQAGEPKEHDEA